MTTLSSAAVTAIDELLANYRKEGPGTVVAVANVKGDMIYEKATGKRSVAAEEEMAKDQIFWIASCTKVVTGLAAMQLVEQGKLELDAPVGDLVEELREPDIIYESSATHFKTRKATKKITLRHLLTHTAGFSYSWYNQHLRNWVVQQEKDEFSGLNLDMPLIREPGEAFDYGTNMDWAGIVIERATGLTLSEYCQANIFDPLGLKDITFEITERPELLARLAGMHKRDPSNNTFTAAEHAPYRMKPVVFSGGGGIFSSARDYLQIITTLLNNGTAPNGHQLVKPETMQLMFQDHVSHLPGTLDSTRPSTDGALAGDALVLMPGQPKGWGLTFLMNLEQLPNGRRAGSAEWGGICNAVWVVDRTSGFAWVVFNNSLPYADPAFFQLEHDVEEVLYRPESLVMA